jgi:hypothetical protein
MNLAPVTMRFYLTIGSQPITVNHDVSDIASKHD